MDLYYVQSFFDNGQSYTDSDNIPYAVENDGVSGVFAESGDSK